MKFPLLAFVAVLVTLCKGSTPSTSESPFDNLNATTPSSQDNTTPSSQDNTTLSLQDNTTPSLQDNTTPSVLDNTTTTKHGHRHKNKATTTANPRSLEERLSSMESVIEGLSRQVMLQQFFVEEKVRSDGNSGIKQIRVTKDGTKNYHTAAHVGSRFLSMHDHANYDRTVGMGELMAVMNGVEFRTRHNDYKLRMPSMTSEDYHVTEDISFPEVPPSVLEQKTIEKQIVEMRKYFKAFKTQNTRLRDYRPYFKPVLCYMEGAWTTASTSVDEPFQSDRHAIDAKTWFDLMDKVRFSSYTGTKSVLENFSYLPTTILNVEDGVPQYAQWNYRILCHPINEDLPLSSFKLDDDLLFRFPVRKPFSAVEATRAARYHLNERENEHYNNGRSLLDRLMYTVPGKNNYPGLMHDDSFNMVIEDINFDNHTLVNTGYYHRYFKTLDKGAMGTKSIHRGFSDANLFVAQTTHKQIAPMTVTQCGKKSHKKECSTWTVRYTYAIPLEVIYLTPLFSWNPYDLATNVAWGDLTANGVNGTKRNGKATVDLAFNGTNYKNYYLTPSEFYTSGSVGKKDPADTAKAGAGVLDKDGVLRIMSSSGQRILTPDIEGVGQVRLRYPIAPLHGEGSGVWKELNALKDMTMHMNRYAALFEERPGLTAEINGTDTGAILHFQVGVTHQDPPGEHSHDFYINKEELDEIQSGHHVIVTTSEEMGHTHTLELGWKHQSVWMTTCDGAPECWDGHPRTVSQISQI